MPAKKNTQTAIAIDQLHDKDKHTAGLILAGGQSTRMQGQNKALCLIQEQSLLSHSIENLHQNLAPNSPIAISTGTHDYAEQSPLEQLPDSGQQGPLAGIAAGLRWLHQQNGMTYLAAIPCDSPFTPANWVRVLQTTLNQSSNCLAAYVSCQERAYFAHSLWHKDALATIDDAISNSCLSLKSVLQRLNAISVDFASDDNPLTFLNINDFNSVQQANNLIKAQTLAPKKT